MTTDLLGEQPSSHNSPSCFISYCHADADRDALQYIMEAIQEHSRREITFHYDQSLSYGTSFDLFTRRIDDSDMVLVILTPQYKERIVNRIGGAYQEFGYIVKKYQDSVKLPKDEERTSIAVLPVLVSGTPETAIPEFLLGVKYLDLRSLVVHRENGKLVRVDSPNKAEFKKIAEQITVRTAFNATLYRETQERYYDELFLKLKHTPVLFSEPLGYRDVLLETSAYRKVKQQQAYFIVGRKGSGKSTITTMLGMLNTEKYKATIGIRADNVNLEHASSNLASMAAVDTEGVLKPLKYFTFAWQGFFVLALIEALVRLEEAGKLSPEQSAYMEPLITFFEGRHLRGGDADSLQQALIVYSIEHVFEFLSRQIKEAPEREGTSVFLARIIASFNLREFLNSLVGESAAQALANVVAHCQKRVLVTLDDFDSVFDSFRRRPVSEKERARASWIEQEWIRSLLLLVVGIKNQRGSANPYFRVFDFCLTIPKDRFSEIERHDRDGYLFNTAGANIQWSGRELCELLVKRLERLSRYRCKERHPRDKLEEVLRQTWPEIPLTIDFKFNNYAVAMPLFLYVLRHTFWRPRDVLLYFGSILAAAMNIREAGEDISVEVVRRIISETTYQIIKTEFLDEYGAAFLNLREVVNEFARQKQVLSFSMVKEVIRGVAFRIYLPETGVFDINEKIELLFDIGFLGIQLDAHTRGTLNIGIDHAFYFNEGRSALRAARKSGYVGTSFIIHPIFTENLVLDSSGNPFLLQMSWDYLDSNHKVMSAAARQW